MEDYKEGQYDDDLTVGIDEYDEDFDTGGVDLFEYMGDDESPLARLKSIILSIDWEITDDILRQFNEELIELKDIWADNKVNLIYIQALEKISRYIYKEKSSAHPNAIKLLLTLYTNLEKIVSDEDMSDREKKTILLEDIEKFEKLKKVISPPVKSEEASSVEEESTVSHSAESSEESIQLEANEQVDEIDEFVSPALKPEPDQAVGDRESNLELGKAGKADPLLNLKAIVYGIDWEITEKDLNNLSREVKTLEEQFSSSKAKKIFLQGIGSLGSYINLKRSDAHADAFKLLHAFFTGLETVIRRDLAGQAEKDILMPLVEKFNTFKTQIADTISPDAVAKSQRREDETFEDHGTAEIQPAFADVPVEDSETEVKDQDQPAAEADGPADIYFDDDGEDAENEPELQGEALASDVESRLEGMFDEPDSSSVKDLDATVALQGVDVESEADDESDEDPLPQLDGGELAPALAGGEDQVDEESPAMFADKVDDFFGDDESGEKPVAAESLPGVDVEHEADDDSDEEPLPYDDGELAPALSTDEDESDDDAPALTMGAEEDSIDGPASDEGVVADSSAIDDRLDHFFGDDDEESETQISQELEEKSDLLSEIAEQEPEGKEEAEPFVSPPEIESDTTAGSDVDDKLSDFFGDDEENIALPTEETEVALQGVDVEHEADDESDEEVLPFENGEIAPALSSDEESDELEELEVQDSGEDLLSASDDAEIEPVHEASEQIEAALELEEDSDEAEKETPIQDDSIDDEPGGRIVGFGLSDEEVPLSEEEALLGVAVEHEADDESDEEPLPFEDGEVAPALSFEGDEEPQEDVFVEEKAAEEISDESEMVVADIDSADDPVADLWQDAEDDDSSIADEAVTETAFTEQLQDIDDEIEPFQDAEPFEEAGFEEIADDEIEELSEMSHVETAELAEAVPTADDEQLLAMLGEDDIQNIEPSLGQEVGEEDDIPELSPEELGAVLLSSEDITSAGEIPSGYPSTRELLSQSGEIAGGESDDFIVGMGEQGDDEQEEVIFEAVEEDGELMPQEIGENEIAGLEKQENIADLSPYSDELDDSDMFGTTLLTDDIPLDTAQHDGAAERGIDEEPVTAELSDVDKTLVDEDTRAYVVPQTDDATEDSLAGVRSSIISLGLEIDDAILGSLNDELEKLRHTWLDRPAEKTFVQLLSTISDHVERFRYESDPEANKLLLSVFDKLEICALGQADAAQIQEMIHTETSKVLQWQQRLIDRKLVGDSIDNQDEQSARSEENEDEFGLALDDMSKKVDALGDDLLMEKMSTIMKSELEQLKNAFQEELKALKDEIMKK